MTQERRLQERTTTYTVHFVLNGFPCTHEFEVASYEMAEGYAKRWAKMLFNETGIDRLTFDAGSKLVEFEVEHYLELHVVGTTFAD